DSQSTATTLGAHQNGREGTMSGASTREALRRRRLFYRPHGRVLLAHFVETFARHFDGADSVGAAERRALPLRAWGRTYLPEHCSRAPSGMHRRLEKQLEPMRHERGQKVNAIGPRGGAKSTIGTLALPLRAALEGSEKYIWIVSDSKQHAAAHLA